jgi:2-oxoglutarate dehydrogenase E1 component
MRATPLIPMRSMRHGQAFFKAMGDTDHDVQRVAQGAKLGAPRLAAGAQSDDLTAALDRSNGLSPPLQPRTRKLRAHKIVGQSRGKGRQACRDDARSSAAVLDSVLRALMIIRAYRIRGHLIADLDPLGMREDTPHP